MYLINGKPKKRNEITLPGHATHLPYFFNDIYYFFIAKIILRFRRRDTKKIIQDYHNIPNQKGNDFIIQVKKIVL